jgi:hypothetical protein
MEVTDPHNQESLKVTEGTGVTEPRNGEGPILTAQDVAEILKRPRTAPRLNLPLYIAGETTLEVLTRSVLVTEGMNTNAWGDYAAVVKEAASDPMNHPVECECEGCL